MEKWKNCIAAITKYFIINCHISVAFFTIFTHHTNCIFIACPLTLPNCTFSLSIQTPYFLRELSEELSKPLFILFQKSLKESVVPMDWLSACITAIYKKGEKDIPGNYRPISLTSALCKLLKSIIKDFIIEHLTRNNLLAEEQHGFVPNRNCITNLLTAIEYWSYSMEEGKSFDLIYTDFSKAFDSVPQLFSNGNNWGGTWMDQIIFNK